MNLLLMITEVPRLICILVAIRAITHGDDERRRLHPCSIGGERIRVKPPVSVGVVEYMTKEKLRWAKIMSVRQTSCLILVGRVLYFRARTANVRLSC